MLITLDGSLISLIVLAIMLLQSGGLTGNKQNVIFKLMVISDMVLITVDLLTWFLDGKPGFFVYIALRFLYILLYGLPVMPSYLFTVYIYDLIQIDITKRRSVMAFFMIFIIVNTSIVLLSLFNGWYFSIDASNVYTRGNLIFLLVIFSIIPFLISIVVLIKNRKRFKKSYYHTLLVYYVPQTAGIVIQYFCYGCTTNWIGMMISLLIVYMNIQSQNLNTDYLTGVNNRRYLEETITAKIRRVTEKKTFLAIMIDIDDFKLINDNFGHDNGDLALKDTAAILKHSIKSEDFVARAGGDEFIILIDISNSQEPLAFVNKIKDNTDKFNAENSRPYMLSLSAGYLKYEYKSAMNTDELLKNIDRLMYENKKKKSSGI